MRSEVGLIGEATVKGVHSLQSIPSKARTERLSVPKPLWNSICASCAADTSMICDAVCAAPPSSHFPLVGSGVLSKS